MFSSLIHSNSSALKLSNATNETYINKIKAAPPTLGLIPPYMRSTKLAYRKNTFQAFEKTHGMLPSIQTFHPLLTYGSCYINQTKKNKEFINYRFAEIVFFNTKIVPKVIT